MFVDEPGPVNLSSLKSLLIIYSAPNNEVYIQGHQIGIASYHFTDEGVYINYENRLPNWRMTNDEAPPNKKYFENVTYDADSRQFMGEIIWGDISLEPNITKWIYRFEFSEDFNIIEKGTVEHISKEGMVHHTSVFGEQLNMGENHWFFESTREFPIYIL